MRNQYDIVRSDASDQFGKDRVEAIAKRLFARRRRPSGPSRVALMVVIALVVSAAPMVAPLPAPPAGADCLWEQNGECWATYDPAMINELYNSVDPALQEAIRIASDVGGTTGPLVQAVVDESLGAYEQLAPTIGQLVTDLGNTPIPSIPDLPPISIPDLPPVTLPDTSWVTIPQLPPISVPDLPPVTLPDTPDATVPPGVDDLGDQAKDLAGVLADEALYLLDNPPVTAPPVTPPDVTVPTVPTVTAPPPPVTIPPVTAPPTSLPPPPVTMPATTVPTIPTLPTVPTVTVPTPPVTTAPCQSDSVATCAGASLAPWQIVCANDAQLCAEGAFANGGPFGPTAEVRSDANHHRQDRDLYTPLGSPRHARARGYLASDALTFGGPCVARSGRFRPECTAQAHAIRKLNSMVRGEKTYIQTPRVQWEVGKSNTGCTDDVDEACEPLDAANYRVDIVLAPPAEAAGSAQYGLIEVKRYSGPATVVAVNAQLAQYGQHLTADGIASARTAALNNVGTEKGVGWAVWYTDSCTCETWVAWAPRTDDDEPYPATESLNGHVYFAKFDDAPQKVRDRAVQGDADWQSLRAAQPVLLPALVPILENAP